MCRLHMVQASLVGSQWRAFRGRKWNPLKGRVDALPPGAPPLSRVINAVLFTLVVFLLPTTTIYYLVFTSVSGQPTSPNVAASLRRLK